MTNTVQIALPEGLQVFYYTSVNENSPEGVFEQGHVKLDRLPLQGENYKIEKQKFEKKISKEEEEMKGKPSLWFIVKNHNYFENEEQFLGKGKQRFGFMLVADCYKQRSDYQGVV